MTTGRRNAVRALVLSGSFSLFWIACVASLHRDELIVGAAAVALSLGFSLFMLHRLPVYFRPTAGDLLQVRRLPRDVVVDLARIVVVLAEDCLGRRAPSVFRCAPWQVNGKSGRDVARRVLAVAYTSVSPNCIVVGIDRKRQQILLHQLRPDGLPTLTQRLGAGEPA